MPARTPRNPASTSAWRALKQHHKNVAHIHLRQLFATDPERVSRFSLESNGLYVDFSKHRVTDETLSLLLALAAEMQIPRAIKELFSGDRVNSSERRPALHTALRLPQETGQQLCSKKISDMVQNELTRMAQFITELNSGSIKGYNGRAIETLVNIGIGGSDLGPRLACDALTSYRTSRLRIQFVANADPQEIRSVLATSNPETTLFIISSKSFTTQETLANAQRARQWLHENGCRDDSGQFAAVTANPAMCIKFGIPARRIFRTWDWVGGRYSVWSAAGLPVAVSIGMDNFRAFLAGAHAMDMHFHSTPLEHNIPAVLALLDIWYINFFNCTAQAVIPYSHALKLLPRYLGQLLMESNGKSIRRDQNTVSYHTAAIVWGDHGANAQHTFMQLLHQGTHLVPVDFLAGSKCNEGGEQKNMLLAHCLAQSQALMLGNDPDQSAHAQSYKTIAGNKPSTTILYEKLTPAMLGTLLAMYEHRTYIQSCLWNINAFDQWGVELGKTLAADIQAELNGHNTDIAHDASTRHLIKRINKFQSS